MNRGHGYVMYVARLMRIENELDIWMHSERLSWRKNDLRGLEGALGVCVKRVLWLLSVLYNNIKYLSISLNNDGGMEASFDHSLYDSNLGNRLATSPCMHAIMSR